MQNEADTAEINDDVSEMDDDDVSEMDDDDISEMDDDDAVEMDDNGDGKLLEGKDCNGFVLNWHLHVIHIISRQQCEGQ